MRLPLLILVLGISSIASAQPPGKFPPGLRDQNVQGSSSSAMSVFKGNIELMKGDTSAAEAAFREAIRRDSTNTEARGRLQAIGKK
jgi:hypothetical protein